MFSVALATHQIRLDESSEARTAEDLRIECEAMAGKRRGKLMFVFVAPSDRFVRTGRCLRQVCRSPNSGQEVNQTRWPGLALYRSLHGDVLTGRFFLKADTP